MRGPMIVTRPPGLAPGLGFVGAPSGHAYLSMRSGGIEQPVTMKSVGSEQPLSVRKSA